jgi:hypothetical protein
VVFAEPAHPEHAAASQLAKKYMNETEMSIFEQYTDETISICSDR